MVTSRQAVHAIRSGTLLHGTGADSVRDAVVPVEDGRIGSGGRGAPGGRRTAVQSTGPLRPMLRARPPAASRRRRCRPHVDHAGSGCDTGEAGELECRLLAPRVGWSTGARVIRAQRVRLLAAARRASSMCLVPALGDAAGVRRPGRRSGPCAERSVRPVRTLPASARRPTEHGRQAGDSASRVELDLRGLAVPVPRHRSTDVSIFGHWRGSWS